MPVFEKGAARIRYEEGGTGFPVLTLPGGGLNSKFAQWGPSGPYDFFRGFQDEFRTVTMDQRNANGGESKGPLDLHDPWGAFADDQLAVMDHLGIREFMALGCCIGGPFMLKLLERAPERVVAVVLCQPVGHRPEDPDVMYRSGTDRWAPELKAENPDITDAQITAYLDALYRRNPDLMYSVDRDFVRNCKTPMLVMPDDIAAHPYKVAMEVADLAPNAEVSIYPWKDTEEHTKEAVAHARRFLRQHQPALAR